MKCSALHEDCFHFWSPIVLAFVHMSTNSAAPEDPPRQEWDQLHFCVKFELEGWEVQVVHYSG